MILIDLNGMFISHLMEKMKGFKPTEIDENLIRNVILDTLRSYIKKYKSKYGDIVICCDSRHYWRKDYFPFYKANRKKTRDKSPLDWTLIFDCLSKIKDELQEVFPHKIIDIHGAEADDIIATISKNASEDVLIISSDGDFAQLQKYPNVSQFSPKLKQYVKIEDPTLYLKEHIIRGDSGDGVPNILSNDNVFTTNEKQKSITKEKIQKWLIDPEFQISEEFIRNWNRNQTLIDFDYIPEKLQIEIIKQLKTPKKGNCQKLMTYLMENKCFELLKVLDEF